MYRLDVHHSGSPSPVESHQVPRAADVLALIPELLKKRDGCEKIAVYGEATLLFAVDCKGDRL